MPNTERAEFQPRDPKEIRLGEQFMPFDPLHTIHEEPSSKPYVSTRTLLLPNMSSLDIEFDALLPDVEESPDRLELEVLVGYDAMMSRTWSSDDIKDVAKHLGLAVTDRTGVHIARSTFKPSLVANRKRPLVYSRFDFYPSQDHGANHPPTTNLPLWLPVRHGGGVNGDMGPMTAQFVFMK